MYRIFRRGGRFFQFDFLHNFGGKAGEFPGLPFFFLHSGDLIGCWTIFVDVYIKAILFLEWNGPGTPFAVNAAEKKVTFSFGPKTDVRLNYEYTSTSLEAHIQTR